MPVTPGRLDRHTPVIMVRPGRSAIVTTGAEPPCGRSRHNGMLNTLSLNRRSARTRRTRFGAAAGLTIGGAMLAGGILLTGCSGSSASSASSAMAQGEAVPSASGAAAAPAAGQPGGGAGQPGGGAGQPASTGTTARLAPVGDIVYTAQLTVRAGNVSSAAAKATQIIQAVGGYVSNETASADPDHPSEAIATVQLKIPVASYPATLSQLAGSLGTQLSLQEQAQDVTEQVADVNSQVTSDEAAIAQLRALLSHAVSVGDLLSVQNQINSE
jgi:hypothetical protein